MVSLLFSGTIAFLHLVRRMDQNLLRKGTQNKWRRCFRSCMSQIESVKEKFRDGGRVHSKRFVQIECELFWEIKQRLMVLTDCFIGTKHAWYFWIFVCFPYSEEIKWVYFRVFVLTQLLLMQLIAWRSNRMRVWITLMIWIRLNMK